MKGRTLALDSREDLKRLPSVSEVLEVPGIAVLVDRHPRSIVVRSIRETLAIAREEVMSGKGAPTAGSLVDAVTARVQQHCSRSLRRVINATGIVLHTNLGRSLLAREAVDAVVETATSYVNLEYDLEKGERSSRQDHVAALIRELTGAEDAVVVNNNAGAVLLCLDTVASGREVIVSRGQLVEIGGSFRLPDIMEKSGARLVEVGTTNRTYLSDYREAISESTALLLRVHPSNFRQVGYTAEVESHDLVLLGREHGLIVMEDQGSGTLLNMGKYGIFEETVRDSIRAGVDLVTFSGDKLLGGPQAGMIAGRSDMIRQVRKNPLARALRIDKLSLAALEATLRLYVDEERVMNTVPVLKALSEPGESLRARALKLARMLEGKVPAEIGVGEGMSQAGGGSNPGEDLPTWLVTVKPLEESASSLEERLRHGKPPVIARIQKEHVVFDVRTVKEEDLPALAEAVRSKTG